MMPSKHSQGSKKMTVVLTQLLLSKHEDSSFDGSGTANLLDHLHHSHEAAIPDAVTVGICTTRIQPSNTPRQSNILFEAANLGT